MGGALWGWGGGAEGWVLVVCPVSHPNLPMTWASLLLWSQRSKCWGKYLPGEEGSEHVTPRYSALAYWLSWAEGTWEAEVAARALCLLPFCLQAGHNIPYTWSLPKGREAMPYFLRERRPLYLSCHQRPGWCQIRCVQTNPLKQPISSKSFPNTP